MKILICGFSGAGKSTFLLKFKAKSLNYQLIDLDCEIVKELGIGENELGHWIDSNGMDLFRAIEFKKLEQFLASSQNIMLALGGGALSDAALGLIKQTSDVKLVFIDTDFQVCAQRIRGDGNRALSKKSLEQLEKIYLERKNNYLQADLILSEKQTKEIEGLESLLHNLSVVSKKM